MSGCFQNDCPNVSGMGVRMFPEHLSGYFQNGCPNASGICTPRQKTVPLHFHSPKKAVNFHILKVTTMNSTFICRHCQCHCQRNPRIKNQKYCSCAVCQNARKRLYEKRTLSTPRGQASKKIRNKKWRDKRPAHEYQKHYRETHSEYVKHNRDLQRGAQ